MLEYSLIKQHSPRFNVRLRDDKSYPFLAVTLDDEWPRAMVVRGRKRKGVRYFGPYAHAYAIRDTLDLLLRSFPIRTCSPSKYHQHHRLGRPCLLFHIEKCSGPCVGEIDHPEYDALVEELIDFLDGDTDAVVRRLESRDAIRRRRAGVRAGGPRAGPAGGGAEGHRQAADGGRQQRGPRRHRHRTGRPGSGRPDLLRATGAGRGPEGVHPRQGRGARRPRPRRPDPRGAVRRRTPARRAEAGAAPVRPRGAGGLRGVAGHPASLPRGHPRAPTGRQARPAGHGHPQRAGGVHPAPPAPGHGPQQPGPGHQRAPGPARRSPKRRCASSATTWPTSRAPITSGRWW